MLHKREKKSEVNYQNSLDLELIFKIVEESCINEYKGNIKQGIRVVNKW